MKRFTIPCDFGDEKAPFHVYVGAPRKHTHPLQWQSHWLSVERGGIIPADAMESFKKIHELAIENNRNFEDLSVYALLQNSSSEEEQARLKIHLKNVDDNYKKNGNPYITGFKWPSSKKTGSSASDSIFKISFEKTTTQTVQMAKEMFSGTDYISCSARNLFLGITIYLGLAPDKPLTVNEILHSITNPDADYSLSVVLDTLGGCMPLLGYRLIGYWLKQNKRLRDDVLTRMTTGMIEFAFSPPKKTDVFRDMRKTIQKELLKG